MNIAGVIMVYRTLKEAAMPSVSISQERRSLISGMQSSLGQVIHQFMASGLFIYNSTKMDELSRTYESSFSKSISFF